MMKFRKVITTYMRLNILSSGLLKNHVTECKNLLGLITDETTKGEGFYDLSEDSADVDEDFS